MLEKYQVTAIFAGHYHGEGGSQTYMGSVPMFLSGAASQQTYLTASFSKDRKQLEVSLVEGNQWRHRQPVATVPVKSIWASRP
jgi:cytolysin (calcineurin-like family phosphatase)